MDPRQGCADRYHKCQTCAGSISQCPGHFGHIELSKPVFHIGYMPSIMKILRCFCLFCSQFKVDPSTPAFRAAVDQGINNPKHRLNLIYQVVKGRSICEPGKAEDDADDDEDLVNTQQSGGRKCTRQGCGRAQPKYTLKGLEIFVEWKGTSVEEQDKKQLLSPERVLEMFKRISDEDCNLIGLNSEFSRPEWMIITVLPVPPLAVFLTEDYLIVDKYLKKFNAFSIKSPNIILELSMCCC